MVMAAMTLGRWQEAKDWIARIDADERKELYEVQYSTMHRVLAYHRRALLIMLLIDVAWSSSRCVV